MTAFHDLLGSVTTGEDGVPVYPEGFTDSLSVAYDDDMAPATAKIEQMTGELADAQAQLLAAKAVNYDLLMAQPQDSTADSDPDNSANNEDAAPEVADFFAPVEDEK